MKLKFVATAGFDSYEEFTDGIVAEVDRDRANYLLSTFPEHFYVVEEPRQKQAEAPPKNKAERAPKSNK